MTLIIALRNKNKTFIASDGLCLQDDIIVGENQKKIFEYNNSLLVGYSGNIALINVIDDYLCYYEWKNQNLSKYALQEIFVNMFLENTKIKRLIDQGQYVEMLLTIENKLFNITSHGDFIEVNFPYAIGTGSETALGSFITFQDTCIESMEDEEVKSNIYTIFDYVSKKNIKVNNNVTIETLQII